MPPRCRWILGAIWLAFLIHGTFYCQFIPLWEGFDEWGHYAFLEHLRLHGGALPRTTDGVTEEIRQSVQSARFRHEAGDPLKLFEAQQPPLYYWVLWMPNRMAQAMDISTRVHILRWLSVLIASLAIPLGYLAAIEVFHSRAISLSVCALVASMPALMIDIARVGNESLAVALASWVLLLLLKKRSPGLGLALGLGLLTKAYFLAFIPILIWRRRFASLAASVVISGWWYWRNFRLTGSLTGEIMDVAATKMGWPLKLVAITKEHWLATLDSAMWTHIWTGGWSFFTVKSWMYRVFELIFVVAAVALVLSLLRRPIGRSKAKLALLCSMEVLFAAGIAYQSLSIFLEKNISFAPGWYFYALVVAEAILLAAGMLLLFGRRRAVPAMVGLTALFLSLDFYGAIFVMARRYRS